MKSSVSLYRRRAGLMAGTALLASMLWSGAAQSQSQTNDPVPLPPDSKVMSPGGVDMRTGYYVLDQQQLSIGSGPGAIELKMGDEGRGGNNNIGKFGQFSDNWGIKLTDSQTAYCNLCTSSDISVSIEGVSYNFITSGGTSEIKLISNNGFARLSRTIINSSSQYYTLTTSSGETAVFQPTTIIGGTAIKSTAIATRVTRPDGIVFTYTSNGLIINKVESNAGYALVLEHGNSGYPANITKACVINLATTTAGTICPPGVETTSYSYSSGRLVSRTDRTGAVWNISSNSVNSDDIAFSESFYRPGETTPYLTNNVGGGPAGRGPAVLSQDFADGRHFTYDYTLETYALVFANGEESDKDMNVGSGWTLTNSADGTNLVTSLTFGSNGALPPTITPTPISVTDPLGRNYQWNYVFGLGSSARLTSRTLPEGNGEAYTYDAYRNRTQVDRSPKPGSGQAHIITSAIFGNCDSFANLVACDKPTSVTDARGNVTTYTYDPTHGGVLTQTGPANANGIQPVMRSAYAQRYAWISNGAGGYARASSPIWVKTEDRTCRSTATTGNSCAGGAADEVVTSYDYGPDSGPNNLWLRGTAVTADGQTRRTCYGYDSLGNKISETSPRAGLAVCP